MGWGAASQWSGNFCGGGGLELQRNDVTWVPVVDVEVLKCCSWREGGEADEGG